MLQNMIPMLMKLGATEILLILAIVLVLFGPTYLPKLSKRAGKTMKEWNEVGDKVGAKAPAPDGIIEVEPIEVVKVMTVETTATGQQETKVVEVIDIQ